MKLLAILVPFFFTSPHGDTGRYEGVWCENQECVGKNLYNGPNGYVDGPLQVLPEGETQNGWIVLTESRPVSGVLYVYPVAPDGYSPPRSNPLQIETKVRQDTLMAWVKSDSTYVKWAVVSDQGVAKYSHRVDGTPDLVLLSQTGVQAKMMPVICRIYGYWVHSGRRWPCP